MLRRIRHIALLLLIVLTAQGQNIGSYECWIDADYSSRVTSTIVGSSIEQSIDIGRLSQGVHYLNFRANDPNEGICPLYRYMFFVPGKELTESDMTQYEYWIDADYAHRVSTAATGTEALQTIDVSSLSQGVHYLNFRAISASEGICPLTRYMFFVPESENALEQVDRIEYWLDDAEDSLQTMSVDQSGELAIVMDISHLQPDSTHYFNVRGIMKNGQLGLSERYDFSFSVPTAEPYAVLTGDTISGMTLTFYYDDQKAIRGGTDVKPFKLGWYDDVWTVNSGWHDQCNALTSVVFDESFANCTTLTSTDYWFYSCGNLATIQGIENLKTDNVTSMDCMFWGCSGLTNLDVSGFKTDSVTDTYAMFYNCSRLTSLDLSSFNMSKVEYMNQMFAGCSALKTIYASDWNVPAIIDGSYMFYGCSSLVGGKGTTYDENRVDYTYAHIDGGPDNPGYFTRSGDAPYTEPELYAVLEENMNANSMVDAAPNRAATAKTYTMKFYYDGKKTERNGMSVETYREATTREWDNMAESITNVVFDLTVVNDTAITSTGYWFSGFTQLTSIEGLNYLNTSHVADTWAMFEKCSSLKEVNLSNFDTRNVKTMGLMFYGCENLLNLDVSSFNTANVTHTNSMFANCIGLTSLDLSGFNTRKVENMSEMFLNCTHLTTIYAGSDWSTESSAGGGKMFGSCYSLVGGMGTTYDENHVDGTYAHIDGGPDNPGYLTDIADTAKLETVETPTFRFEYMYDMDLTIETETDDAEIYYTLNGRMLEGDDTNFGYNSLSRYSKWSVWGDNKQDAKTERSGYNGSYCLMVASGTDGSFESAQAGYKFSNPLTEGDYYTIRFMARSKSGNGKLQFYCQNDTLPNTRSAADTLTIGSQFADYEVTLKIDNDKTNQFVLNFGAVADTYYIDNVLFGPVISDTTNLLRTRYESPIELRQGVTIKAVAVKEGMKDSEPAVWDYFYEGWMNMLETYEKCKMICDMVEGDPNVPLAMVYDVRMRLEDMLYRYYERRLEERFDDEELLSAADEMRSYASILETMMRGFFVDGVYYHAVDSTHAEVIAPLDYYTTYRNAINVAKEVHYNDLDFQVTSVAQGAFANSTLAAIVWNPTVALKYEDVAVINNPNLLVYVNEASLAPENVTNLVVNGLAKNIELVDADNNNFYCPQAFTAEAISYTREFRQETQVGVSRGWEAIALPFDVQTIMHEKQGMIAPFGNSASNKHFWLRRLSSNGLVSADKMEANVPYIISMPNNPEYSNDYNLPGRVTFSSANVTVPVTESRTLALADSTIMMASTMQRLNRSSSYYALNVGEVRGQYLEGSVFERNYREVRPFEAYTIHRSDTPAPRFVPVNALMGGTTGIEDVIELMSDDRGEGTWHDLQGRKVANGKSVNGKLPRGVYIRNGKKTVVR